MVKTICCFIKKISAYMEFLALLTLSAFFCLPIFSAVVPFYVVLAIELAYIFYIFLVSDGLIRKRIVFYLLTILFVTFCYYFLTKTKTVDNSDSLYNLKRFISKFNQLINFFLPLIFFFRIKQFSPKKQIIILVFIFSCIFFVLFKSLLVYIPQLSSAFSRQWAQFNTLEKNNVATYSYIYSMSVFLPLIYVFSRTQTKLYLKFLGFLVCVFLFIFLCVAQYTISIFIPIMIILFYELKHLDLAKTIVVLIPVFIFLFFLPTVLYNASKGLPYGTVRNRLMATSSFLYGHTTGQSELLDRLTLYKKSITSFFASPLIGNQYLDFDGHSTFLTMLCDIGLVGSIPSFFLYIKSAKNTQLIQNSKASCSIWIPSFISMIIVGLLNPIHASYMIGFVVWFVGPLLSSTSFEVQKNNELYSLWI